MVDVSESQAFILDLLAAGHFIRCLDGRWDGGFVDLPSLHGLIAAGRAQTFTHGGMTFARRPVRHDDRPRHKPRRR